MKANLHTVLKELTASHPDAAKLHRALDLAAQGKMYRQLARETRALFYPKKPAGMRFSKMSFWAALENNDVWTRAMQGCTARQNAAAKWIAEYKERREKRGEAWPPKAYFEPMPDLPQPRTGETGRMVTRRARGENEF